jgi:hypothetical protein
MEYTDMINYDGIEGADADVCGWYGEDETL